MSEPLVRIHRRGATATVQLNRPEAMNAWNGALGAELLSAISEVAADDEIRAVCVTGSGKGFCSGADLKEMLTDEERTASGTPDVERLLHERYHPVILAMRTMEKPVIAAVNGPAVGVGLSLALAADLVIARQSAYFLLAFVNIGLAPDGGSSFFIPERIGFARAAEMAMLGERIPAERAVEWGLINRVVADEDFEAETEALLDRLGSGATTAHRAIKRQLNSWQFARMDEQLALEAKLQAGLVSSADFVEGVTAFVQRRPASFQGR